MSADDYNKAQIAGGRLTVEHITALVRFFQERTELDDDGKAGPRTRALLEKMYPKQDRPWCWPVRRLADGRVPHVTSGFRNPWRKNHSGVDIMFPYLTTDPPMKIGDGGRTAKWWVPEGTQAVAIGDGWVSKVDKLKTGYRVLVKHRDTSSYTSGYYHLADVLVKETEDVKRGQPLGTISDNPADYDPDHLHFELATGNGNRVDPMVILADAEILAGA